MSCQDRDMSRYRSISTEPSSRRRILGRLLFVAGLAFVLVQLAQGFTAATSLRYRIGPDHDRFDELELRYLHEGSEVAGARLSFPGGVPATFDHTVTLPRGDVEVELSLRGAHAEPRQRSHRFRTPAEGTLVFGP